MSEVEIMCHCGEPLHYSDPDLQRQVQFLVDKLGPLIPVTAGSRTFMVPRHYIALHGIKAQEVPGLGFKEVSNAAA